MCSDDHEDECPTPGEFAQARHRLAQAGEANLSDVVVGKALAETFLENWKPGMPEHLVKKAAADICETLAKVIPGCLSGNQANDEDVQALLFAATAARHGWVMK